MVDYSLYLVTDSTQAILGSRDITHVVEQAIQGGVTIVQYRAKIGETAELISNAKRLHTVTQRYNIPLLINDRVDVALAVGAQGVHIGQEDIDLATAQRLLGRDAIIGVTVTNNEEALAAAAGGASYLGIGTVYATQTKKNSKAVIGHAGVRDILTRLSEVGHDVPCVAIGGLNESNVHRVMLQTQTAKTRLQGLAIVSAIMAAKDPSAAAALLKQEITRGAHREEGLTNTFGNPKDLVSKIAKIVANVSKESPLCHNMTNLVVQNFAANVAIAIGASPIMANYGEEARDLASLGGALVINMGTVTPDGLSNYSKAIQAYNQAEGPILFDPVGGGATSVRREAVKTLMNVGYFDAIKGNESEIATVLGNNSLQQQKGVDSSASTTDDETKALMVKTLAAREKNIVIMTGKVDYLSDGNRLIRISNGHPLLGKITGSGCTLGTTIAAFMAVGKEDKLLAAMAAILMFEIASEMAAERVEVRGPGTFVPAFLDQLHSIAEMTALGQNEWLQRARYEVE